MIFKGYSKVFSTINNKQYDLIGEFWDEMSFKYDLEDLRGLGFNWTETTIEYVIGLKNNKKFQNNNYEWKEMELPDGNWEITEGKTGDLEKIYNNIYKISSLKYEIEMFYKDGTCKIVYIRNK